eukprot:6179488-Pleurochrysis_carterae.AAC.1
MSLASLGAAIALIYLLVRDGGGGGGDDDDDDEGDDDDGDDGENLSGEVKDGSTWQDPDATGIYLLLLWLYASAMACTAAYVCLAEKPLGPFRPSPLAPLTEGGLMLCASVLLFVLACSALALCGFDDYYSAQVAGILLGLTLFAFGAVHETIARALNRDAPIWIFNVTPAMSKRPLRYVLTHRVLVIVCVILGVVAFWQATGDESESTAGGGGGGGGNS